MKPEGLVNALTALAFLLFTVGTLVAVSMGMVTAILSVGNPVP